MPYKGSASLPMILLIGSVIAVFAPFDFYFTAATFDSPLLRVILICLLALAGASRAERLGLKLEVHGARYPLLIGLAFSAGIAAYVVLLDCFLFRPILDAPYVQFLHQPLGFRLGYFMSRAFNENIIYRLCAFSILWWFITRLRGGRVGGAALMLGVATAAQAINIGANVVLLSPIEMTPLTLVYDALRYVVPGVIYAWLFSRFGFFTAEVASVCCHIFLQPAFSLLL